ncbi:hypothetical protein J2X76_003668 [Neorhizobium sp. 2083]|uniref:hypothetical protein n=1 Tax=Neorhizobium sp. 2083 TaxID=2817762 RepID=UPI00286719B5|nr:hypothetical protein [Neorhizobium sp. 2083]MDR6818491.1 hypothetical protein [Neorhizobium sp. 2083]
MPCYIELGHAGAGGFPAIGPRPMELKTGAFPVKLEGSHDAMVVSSDEPGWLHVGREHDDKAAIGKSRRILPTAIRSLSGIGGGMYVSFIADEAKNAFKKRKAKSQDEQVVSGEA